MKPFERHKGAFSQGGWQKIISFCFCHSLRFLPCLGKGQFLHPINIGSLEVLGEVFELDFGNFGMWTPLKS